MSRAVKVNLRYQQLRDLSACLRSHAAEFEAVTMGLTADDADFRLMGLRNHLDYILVALAKKGKR